MGVALTKQRKHIIARFGNAALNMLQIRSFWFCREYILDLHSCILKWSWCYLFPKPKMADVGKLISLGNLVVRKVTWLVLTTTSTTLILSRAFWSRLPVPDCLYILSPFKNSFLFDSQRQHILLHCYLQRSHAISHFDFQQSTPRKYIHSATFFPLLPFRLDLLQPRTQPQKFHQNPKETT